MREILPAHIYSPSSPLITNTEESFYYMDNSVMPFKKKVCMHMVGQIVDKDLHLL